MPNDKQHKNLENETKNSVALFRVLGEVFQGALAPVTRGITDSMKQIPVVGPVLAAVTGAAFGTAETLLGIAMAALGFLPKLYANHLEKVSLRNARGRYTTPANPAETKEDAADKEKDKAAGKQVEQEVRRKEYERTDEDNVFYEERPVDPVQERREENIFKKSPEKVYGECTEAPMMKKLTEKFQKADRELKTARQLVKDNPGGFKALSASQKEIIANNLYLKIVDNNMRLDRQKSPNGEPGAAEKRYREDRAIEKYQSESKVSNELGTAIIKYLDRADKREVDQILTEGSGVAFRKFAAATSKAGQEARLNRIPNQNNRNRSVGEVRTNNHTNTNSRTNTNNAAGTNNRQEDPVRTATHPAAGL